MKIEPSYQQTLDYIYSFVDYSLQRNFRNAPEKFDLSRMRAFMNLFGAPQDRYPTIHVAGTKGKGSVSALCASALQAQGYKVGLYTSPHLQDYVERIQVNGKPIPHDELTALVEECKDKIEAIPQLSSFEITTGLAFYFFYKQAVDVAVIEVGLGGRLDATNIVQPKVSVITSLSYDHMAILGNTLAEIAGEKAGIIKVGVPVVSSPQKEEARQVVEHICQERHAPLIQVGKDYLFCGVTHSLEGQSLIVIPDSVTDGEKPDPVSLEVPLLGCHQVENTATAYAALKTACQNGLMVSEQAIKQGFARVAWPGRFEVLQRDPAVVLDSAHNRDSALRLREALEDYFPGRLVIFVVGASEDKDIQGMLDELMPRVYKVVATQAVHPRAIEPEKLVEMAQGSGHMAKAVKPVKSALIEALHIAGKENVVLVAGSIFVVAEARTAWQELSEKNAGEHIIDGVRAE